MKKLNQWTMKTMSLLLRLTLAVAAATATVRGAAGTDTVDDANVMMDDSAGPPRPHAPGFVGVYHAATGNVNDGKNTRAWDVGQFGIVALENSPGDGLLTFEQNMQANCKTLGVNALYGML
eukprot:SAG11_NODE_25198_length_362_cov_0.832700_1_plen_120_part_11